MVTEQAESHRIGDEAHIFCYAACRSQEVSKINGLCLLGDYCRISGEPWRGSFELPHSRSELSPGS